jgi:HD-GYP domain-containing protein (c-di-GMP phosphodiesterase class II)
MEHRSTDTPESTAPDTQVRQPVLRRINEVHRELEHLLFNLEHEPDAQSRLLAVAGKLVAAISDGPDIALACILHNQDEGSYAVRHCIDTAIVAMLVARALDKLPREILTVVAAALTMNIGMLHKHEQLQSRLNAISNDELADIQAHPQHGVDILRRAGITDEEWLDCVLLHHENEDGSGYPFGKNGDEIPINVKIISLADRYCARVSSRSYRRSLLPIEALRDILLADHQIVDPMLTACFIRVVGMYPTGAVVRLASGEIGVVSGKGSDSTAPAVQVLVGGDGVLLGTPVRRDTGVAGFGVREMLSGEQAGVRFRMWQVWGEDARS